MGHQSQHRLTREGARLLDSAATERFEIPSIVLMENAAIGLRHETLDVLQVTDWALIVCGPGNNGGDGFALARHLTNAGVLTIVATTITPGEEAADAALNLAIMHKMRIPSVSAGDGPDALRALIDERGSPGVIVDALFGTGLTRPIDGRMGEVVRWMNEMGETGVPLLAVDIPSGLDANSGQSLGETVRAHRTVTFVAPKAGFDALEAQVWIGDVRVVGIGAPASLLDEFGAPGVSHPGESRTPATDPGPRGRSV